MNQYSRIFQDSDTPVEQLLDQVGTLGWQASAADVSMIQAAHAIDGENWAPQLTPYEEWKPQGDGSQREGHVGDLFSVGFMNLGVSEELRLRLVANGLEEARKLAEREKQAEEQAEAEAVDPDAVDLSQVFGVKEGRDGFVLSKVDLRQYAKRCRRDRDLVVVLPSHVEGVPITRIDSDAFSRFNVRGIGVRLLVVPDTVHSVDARAFSYLAAEAIYLGRECRNLGSQPLERWALKPAIERRTYVVSPANEWWTSVDGSIFSKDGSHLVFFAPPYGKRVSISAGVRRVGADAFAKWGSIPEVVECGHELERVASKQWDGSLWLCPQDAPAFEALVQRNVRLAGSDVATVDDCWYDFDERGALLVAGPPAPPSVSQTFAHAVAASAKAARGARPAGAGNAEAGASSSGSGGGAGSASDAVKSSARSGLSAADLAKQVAHAAPAADVLSVPRAVHGHPVVRIAPRALVTAPQTLILPESIEVVGHDNSCKGTRHLSLPQGLRRIEAHSFCSRELQGVVSIPASVESIGEGCFEYAVCRLEHTGTIVHVSANQLLNCFIERTAEEAAALRDVAFAERVPFDLARYDDLLCKGQNLPNRVGALVHRIASPVGLSDASRESIVGQLRSNAQEAMEFVAREGDTQMVARLADAGFIDESTFDTQIELLRRANRTDCVMLLMERRRAQAQPVASARTRFAL
ncbi:MAG: hypothetical protein J5804_00805 [Eggerthellaceae bacterium]|nr:hypothetical protein [Eggerthellaceae bacterium]